MENEELKNVSELIENKESDKLKELLKNLHPADIAELCNELDAEEARFVYLLLDMKRQPTCSLKWTKTYESVFWNYFLRKPLPNVL